eukprot:TRINITY_DN1615_c0_g1_i10.p2 TRINITY_DN1615_c0_g1~~TRINITY_DN1615_c0_g1_i10.p2  ORF type:complete len:195 (-),score=-10.89 TRINITY_DN1615_c0_g1_i10:491-1075(-)
MSFVAINTVIISYLLQAMIFFKLIIQFKKVWMNKLFYYDHEQVLLKYRSELLSPKKKSIRDYELVLLKYRSESKKKQKSIRCRYNYEINSGEKSLLKQQLKNNKNGKVSYAMENLFHKQNILKVTFKLMSVATFVDILFFLSFTQVLKFWSKTKYRRFKIKHKLIVKKINFQYKIEERLQKQIFFGFSIHKIEL